jgi:hypothetical protein
MFGKRLLYPGVLVLGLLGAGWNVLSGNDYWMRIVPADEGAQIYGGDCGVVAIQDVCAVNHVNAPPARACNCTPAGCTVTHTTQVAGYNPKGPFLVSRNIICDPLNTACVDCLYFAIDQSRTCSGN